MPDVTPHTLRHTSLTWTMQGGATSWDAAGFAAHSSPAMVEGKYGHHSPDFMKAAARALG